jgi:soluble lytic murein transglycosylase
MKRLMLALLGGLMACGDGGPDGSANGDVELSGGIGALRQSVAKDPVLAEAQAHIDAGHPWYATRALAPVLRDARRRSPAAVLLAAQAAAGWEGWSYVDSLLGTQPWIDSSFDGHARELLARAALEQGDDAEALQHAHIALHAAKSARDRGIRQVLLARALDRGNLPDSSAAMYRAAAEALPIAREWLLLRSAGSEKDASVRERYYGRVKDTVAASREPWTEAQARERFSDIAGAAERFERLEAMPQAFRLRLMIASDSASRLRLKTQILRFIADKSGSADARQATEVLDRAFTTHTAAEELVIARSAAGSGPAARAVTGFERARAGVTLTPEDRLQMASALARVDRDRDAITMLAGITAPPRIASQAAYQRARLVMTSRGAAAAKPLLREVADRHTADSASASAALFLLADLLTDEGQDERARATFLELARRFPQTARADDARFQAAMIDVVAGRHQAASALLDTLVMRAPKSGEAQAARYWMGRARERIGDAAGARRAWGAAMEAQPVSYYAMMSARRAKLPLWTPTEAADEYPRDARVDEVMRRVHLLDTLGMDTEARFELDALEAYATTTDRALAVSRALRDYQPSRSSRVARAIVQMGVEDTRVYRLLYPVVHREELVRAARTQRLDPALVAALIRQESSFNPRAVSGVGARGLMQVMPTVGASVARSLQFPVWHPSLLIDPDANMQLGTAHLAGAMRQQPNLERVLAAYNAGASPVSRWVRKAGTGDPEIFVERVPYAETRDYVRLVLRNREMYRALYPDLR